MFDLLLARPGVGTGRCAIGGMGNAIRQEMDAARAEPFRQPYNSGRSGCVHSVSQKGSNHVRAALSAFLVLLAMPAMAQPQTPAPTPPPAQATAPDTSGSARRGQVAVFAPNLAGRRMADGGRVEMNSDSAASAVLPLGSTARIRNLRNGRVAMVRVRDRLPPSDRRIISVSPKVAQFLGMPANGVAQVEVAPLAVPQRDGSMRLGSGTALAGRRAQIVEPPPPWTEPPGPHILRLPPRRNPPREP